MSDESSRSSESSEWRDTVFRLLSHHHRRSLLDCLQSHGGSLALADVADEVAVRECEDSLDAVPAEDVKRIYMSLYHTHVPKLADHRVVTYDQDEDRVALTATADALLQYLETSSEEAPD